MKGHAHNRCAGGPPFGGVFVGVVLRRVRRVRLRGWSLAPRRPHCGPGPPGGCVSVAWAGRGHNLNCAAGGRRCAGRRRPGLVWGVGGGGVPGVVRWLSLPVGVVWVACRWSWPPWRAVPWRANREAALGLPAWGRSAPPSRGFRPLRRAGEDRPARRAGKTFRPSPSSLRSATSPRGRGKGNGFPHQ